jgi:hypothetical protein
MSSIAALNRLVDRAGSTVVSATNVLRSIQNMTPDLKRPPNVFIMWLKANRESIIMEHFPDVERVSPIILKKAGEIWKSKTCVEKNPWEKQDRKMRRKWRKAQLNAGVIPQSKYEECIKMIKDSKTTKRRALCEEVAAAAAMEAYAQDMLEKYGIAAREAAAREAAAREAAVREAAAREAEEDADDEGWVFRRNPVAEIEISVERWEYKGTTYLLDESTNIVYDYNNWRDGHVHQRGCRYHIE